MSGSNPPKKTELMDVYAEEGEKVKKFNEA
jgi:hypothetical protein